MHAPRGNQLRLTRSACLNKVIYLSIYLSFWLAAILFVLAKSLIVYSLLENADTDAGQRTPDKRWKTDDGKTDKRWKKLIMVRSEPISIQYFVMDHVNNKA